MISGFISTVINFTFNDSNISNTIISNISYADTNYINDVSVYISDTSQYDNPDKGIHSNYIFDDFIIGIYDSIKVTTNIFVKMYIYIIFINICIINNIILILVYNKINTSNFHT